ncbi:hypothetical protein AVEN_40270-1 [Araneus ventricosus]|uniref:Uncharacterized protein n=1 Tax=Araneus ventricosus TaxID=182803 RepID=A0A4Y2CBB6_ARAVE|nr:hypothetical protein AVEN_37304-1 [Araneus ventricosus]GBM01107.1 hypothetical protein AVEN_40270-1 [Araneus ventricosus]
MNGALNGASQHFFSWRYQIRLQHILHNSECFHYVKCCGSLERGCQLRCRPRLLAMVQNYEAWDLFSYIGGLVGCWLGISVWALAGIFEKSFRKATSSIHKLKSKAN